MQRCLEPGESGCGPSKRARRVRPLHIPELLQALHDLPRCPVVDVAIPRLVGPRQDEATAVGFGHVGEEGRLKMLRDVLSATSRHSVQLATGSGRAGLVRSAWRTSPPVFSATPGAPSKPTADVTLLSSRS